MMNDSEHSFKQSELDIWMDLRRRQREVNLGSREEGGVRYLGRYREMGTPKIGRSAFNWHYSKVP